jgi:quinol-cytochrome oxidoreductase complex cytochrome b subunit
MNKHTLWMLIGCILPLVLVFILPLFGFSVGIYPFFILAMFACHLFMMRGHHSPADDSDQKKDEKESTTHGHQH